jgi:hypothetical protein
VLHGWLRSAALGCALLWLSRLSLLLVALRQRNPSMIPFAKTGNSSANS